jgi:hypothetical protein
MSNVNKWEMLHVRNFVFHLGDGNWYRALIKEILPNGNVKVHFVDYGNTEEVMTDELRMIAFKFLKLPFQGVRCWLAGIVQNRVPQLFYNMWDI